MPSAAHKSASQVPGAHTFGRDHHLVSIGCNGVQQGIGTGLHSAVQENLAALVKETDIHRTGVQVNAAVIARLFAVESHEVSSL